jgi:hypothetical protein
MINVFRGFPQSFQANGKRVARLSPTASIQIPSRSAFKNQCNLRTYVRSLEHWHRHRVAHKTASDRVSLWGM